MLNPSEDFPYQLKQSLLAALPGDAARAEVMGYKRPSWEQALQERPDARESAVMLLLYPLNEIWHTVLIRRAESRGVHGGQIALPGGAREPRDESAWHTALRETHEEIGVTPADVKPLGALTPLYIPPSNFLVKPYVGWLPYNPQFVLQQNEVAQIIETPLEIVRHTAPIKETWMDLKQGRLKVKYFDIAGHVVWGATAMILAEMRAVLRALDKD